MQYDIAMTKSAFISIENALKKHQSGDALFIDATYGQPIDYTIPGSIIFDIDDIADPQSHMPHMLPSENIFAEKIGAMGIDNDQELIVFDKTGFWMAASRAWWMFRVFGHDNIKILNGGLPQWLGECEIAQPAQIAETTFKSNFQDNLVYNFEDIQNIDEDSLIIDVRPLMAYMAGHISNSVSIPLTKIIDDKGMLRPLSELHHILLPAISSGKRLITSCGSGVTACAMAAALYECGKTDVAVYDGSWSEYSRRR